MHTVQWNEKGNQTRRLISLIFAGWVPHDNLFIGDGLSLESRIRTEPALKNRREYPFIEVISLFIPPHPIDTVQLSIHQQYA